MLDSDVTHLKKFINKNVVQSTMPNKFVLRYQLFWGERDYEINATYICFYFGSEKMNLLVTDSGDTIARIVLDLRNKNWKKYTSLN